MSSPPELTVVHSAGAGEDGRPAQPVFYFDLASPEAYLMAERVLPELPEVAEWQPVLAADLPGAPVFDAFRCANERAIVLEDVERRAADLGLQPVRWPADWPPDTTFAMRAATYAKQIGRTVSFCQAAFRQAFAGGRDLSDPATLLITGAACEMHPNALLKGAELRGTVRALAAATTAAGAAGVREVPALRVDADVFTGRDAIERASEALAARRR